MLISHDLGVIASVCARVVVMYAGEVVEEGPTEEVLSDPRHPYTWALINAVPRIDRHTPGNRRLTTIEGAPPDPLDLPHRLPLRPALPVPHRALRRASRAAARSRPAATPAAG